MAKKRFGIDEATNQALSQTMQLAKDHDSNFINTEILISKIELNPENPRKHKIKKAELLDGPSNNDPDYELKNKEFEGLSELSASIKKDGLLHPIVVFKDADSYKIVAGERRFFACVMAKKPQIEARVFKSKPKESDLKIIQWIENESRKDLSLHKKLLNISAILSAFNQNGQEKLTAIKLSELLSISRQSAQFYMGILSNNALMDLIEKGKVTTFRGARKLINIKTKDELERAITSNPKNSKVVIKTTAKDKRKSPGRKRHKIVLGTTTKPQVVKALIESVLAMKEFSKHELLFKTTDWDCLDQSAKAFQKLLGLLEKETEKSV